MSPMPLPGDANEDRNFDQLDIVQVLQLAKVSLLVFLARIIHEFEPVCRKMIGTNELELSCPEHHDLVGGLSSESDHARSVFVSGATGRPPRSLST